MAGGAGELLKSFKLFSSGKGEIGATQLMSVIQVRAHARTRAHTYMYAVFNLVESS